METKNKIINVLGDSITEGASCKKFNNVYHQVLKRLGKFKKLEFNGIGGTRIARNTKPSKEEKYDKDFLSRYDKLDKNADIYLVFGGTNDYGHGDAPLGKIDDETEYTFCGACNLLFKGIKEKFKKATVIDVLPIHRLNDTDKKGENSCKPKDVGTLEQYAKTLKKVATKNGVFVIDLLNDDKLNPNVEKNNKKYFKDGLHPKDRGHKLLGKRIYKAIKEL